jgi:site-specific DNA-cytosine methylase
MARQEGTQAQPCSAFRPLRFIDLFCGIGGFRIAFERAGAKCVFSSDWDKVSRQTYAAIRSRGKNEVCLLRRISAALR